MPRVALVTDSTANLPKDFLQEYGIHVIPNLVNWGTQAFKDGVDITPTEFFERLKTDPVHPTTSVASLGEMQEVYKRAAASADHVVGIHISGRLSNTFKVAQEAVNLLPEASKFQIVDSLGASMALGFVVLAAARVAAAGASAEAVVSAAQRAIPHTGLAFTVETLKYLQRGGRIGAAQAFLGGMLDLKPVLALGDGALAPLERVRSKRKALERIMDIMAEQLQGKTQVRVAAVHAAVPAEAQELLNNFKNKIGASNVAEELITDLSPTVGVHTGPGTVGLAYLAG